MKIPVTFKASEESLQYLEDVKKVTRWSRSKAVDEIIKDYASELIKKQQKGLA